MYCSHKIVVTIKYDVIFGTSCQEVQTGPTWPFKMSFKIVLFFIELNA